MEKIQIKSVEVVEKIERLFQVIGTIKSSTQKERVSVLTLKILEIVFDNMNTSGNNNFYFSKESIARLNDLWRILKREKS